MRNHKAKLSFFLICLLLPLAALAAPASEPIGTLKLALGTVTGMDQDGNPVELVKGSPLYTGYALTTGARSFVRAEMLDGTRFTMGKNATASLDDFAYDESARIGRFGATVVQGGFEYVSGKIGTLNPRRRHSTISTPTAVLGIRGSELRGQVDSRGKTLVILQSGIVNIAGPSGREVTLDSPGNSAEVDETGEPSFSSTATPEQSLVVIESLPTPEEVEEALSGIGTQGSDGDGEEGDDEDEEADDSDEADETDGAGETDADATTEDGDSASAATPGTAVKSSGKNAGSGGGASSVFVNEQIASPAGEAPQG